MVRAVAGPESGFTIIEVLIVLAVTGAMFISALLLINGKQQVTAFNQSIRGIQTQLQQVINDVGSGYYPNSGDIACQDNGLGGGVKLFKPTTSVEQGTNQPCLFLGKVVQFAVDTPTSADFNVYTLAGLRTSSTGQATNLLSAKARVVAPGTAPSEQSTIPDATETKRLQYGLAVSKMYYNNNPANKIGAVAFTSSLNSLGNADGSQQVNVIAVTGTSINPAMSKAAAADAINANWSGTNDTSIYNPAGGVQICFDSGGTRQSGLLTVGGDSRQGIFDLRIYDQAGCQ